MPTAKARGSAIVKMSTPVLTRLVHEAVQHQRVNVEGALHGLAAVLPLLFVLGLSASRSAWLYLFAAFAAAAIIWFQVTSW